MPTVEVAVVVDPLLPPSRLPRPRRPLVAELLLAVADPDGAQAVPGASRVDIQAGDYLVFTGQGDMPQMVIDTWVRIWHYFAENPQVQRRFGTDFEAYEGPDQVAIHIGVLLQN